MIIKSLILENIRSYKNQKIEFEKGINFLSGDIGCGKSTILLAIEFALFGFKKGDLEGFHILRKGEKEASITLLIENDNSTIEIYRKIKKAKNSDIISQENGYIKINDNLIELAPSELNANIFKILNFPKEFLTKDKNLIYRFTIYTAQEQLKEIIFAESEKRLEVIRKIFGIDKYKQLKDGISVYMGKIREDKKILLTKLEPLEKINSEILFDRNEIEILSNELTNLTEKEKPLIEKIKKYEDGILKREELFEKLVKNILLIEKKLSQIEEIESQNKNFEKEKDNKEKLTIELLKIDYKKLEEEILNQIKIEDKKIIIINENKKELNLKLKEIEVLESDKEKLNKIISEVELKEKLIENHKKTLIGENLNFEIKSNNVKILEISNKISNYDELKLKLEHFKENLMKNKLEIQNLKEKVLDLEKSIHSASELESCPTCLQEVSSTYKTNLHKKIKEETSNLVEKQKEINKLSENLKEVINKSQNELELLDKLKIELIGLKEKYKTLLEKEKYEKEVLLNIEKLTNEILKLDILNSKNKLDKINIKLLENKTIRLKVENLNKDELELRDKISKFKEELLKNSQKSKEIENIKKDILKLEEKIKEGKIEIDKKNSYSEKLKEFSLNEIKIKEEKLKLTNNLNEFKKEEKEFNTQISTKKGILETKNKLLTEKQEKLKELAIIKKNYEQILENENFLANKAINIATNIEKAVFTKYYAEFSEHFETIFKELIEDNNIEIRLDSEFTPIIEQNGYDIDIKNLSGGEKSSVAISYRLALKQIIENNISSQKLSLLILDEPTDGFSKEQIDRLGNLLREINLKQIIIVSHDDKIESISDNIFYIEKINHESKVDKRD